MHDTEAKPPTDDDLDADLTPRENLAMALRYARAHMMCPAGEPWVGDDQLAGADHGHSQCWATGALVGAVEELTAWIRANRGRLHRPTCLDGNGCRCGLIDLPMWGAAG